jgi:hypothetical protein
VVFLAWGTLVAKATGSLLGGLPLGAGLAAWLTLRSTLLSYAIPNLVFLAWSTGTTTATGLPLGTLTFLGSRLPLGGLPLRTLTTTALLGATTLSYAITNLSGLARSTGTTTATGSLLGALPLGGSGLSLRTLATTTFKGSAFLSNLITNLTRFTFIIYTPTLLKILMGFSARPAFLSWTSALRFDHLLYIKIIKNKVSILCRIET